MVAPPPPPPLLLALALLLAAPAARALTVGYFADAACSAQNGTRTAYLGLCARGLAVADCWTLPPGQYSPASYNKTLAARSTWAVLEEFEGGACPQQATTAAGGITSAA
jgi:hypothetical protein